MSDYSEYDDDQSASPFLNMKCNGKTYVLQTSCSSSSEEETVTKAANAKRQCIQSPVKMTLTNRGLGRKNVNSVKPFPYKRTSKTMLRPSSSSSGSTNRILTPPFTHSRKQSLPSSSGKNKEQTTSELEQTSDQPEGENETSETIQVLSHP